MLDAKLEQLWADYLLGERDRIRHVMMPALDRFIDALLELPPATWHAWAKRIAADVSDQGARTPVRFPLFRRVLMPALAEGVRRREAGCARWLESFHELQLQARGTSGLPPELESPYGLLTEALRLDPADTLARRRLIDWFVRDFEYSLHEVPSGVLYGTDGATPEQCEQLLRDLDEFRGHVSVAGETDRHAELIGECDFHYRAYADYLRSDTRDGGYADYLDHRSKPETP
jgi:hypothetical protein